MATHKNAVLIIADDWGLIADAYGDRVISTPHIDAFARRALTFDHAFCTSPSCAASRACILTGLHSHTHGQYGHCHDQEPFRTRPGVATVPKVFSDAGLFSGIVGKSHVAPMESYPFAYQEIGHVYDLHRLRRSTAGFFAECGQRNFYLHVAFGDPHRRGPDHGFRNDFEIEGFDPPRYEPERVPVPGFLPDEIEVRRDLSQYYEAISRFDHGVGLVLEELKKAGREKDTMVIVTSDHGMPFPGAKASSFDSGHHCPFLIDTPDLANRGGRHRALMNWVDIAPTLYDWCGVPQPAGLQGRSLLPILDHPDAPGWDETFLSHTFHEVRNYNPYRILRERRYKFIYLCAPELPSPLPTDLFRSPTWQCIKNKGLPLMGKRPTEKFLCREAMNLFDMEEDPFETENLAGSDAYRGLVLDYSRRLFEFCLKTGDPWMEIPFQKGHLDIDPLTSQ